MCRDESCLYALLRRRQKKGTIYKLFSVLIGKGQRKELDLRVWKLCLSSILTPKLQYIFKKGNRCPQNNHYVWFRNSGFINYPQTGCKNCSCGILCRFHLDTIALKSIKWSGCNLWQLDLACFFKKLNQWRLRCSTTK